MGAVLRSLLACSFCVLLRGERRRGAGMGKLVGSAGGEVALFCEWGGGEGKSSQERPGRGEGERKRERGAREGAARPQCRPPLLFPARI
jgi:hypothetical protein